MTRIGGKNIITILKQTKSWKIVFIENALTGIIDELLVESKMRIIIVVK
jgi:hypothetical protein